MLAAEQERRARLKAQMAGSPLQLACEEVVLFHNYKLLQFFDLLALYFNLEHERARGESQFTHVPREIGEDVAVTIRRQSPGQYTLDPYPFQESPLSVHYPGRPMTPQPPGTDLRVMYDEIEPVTEHIILISG
jgi:hypothetical protein